MTIESSAAATVPLYPSDAIRKPIHWLLAAGVALLPLACWPDLSAPFSTPKLILVCVLAALTLAAAALDRSSLRWPAWPWSLMLTSLGLSAVLAPAVSLTALAAWLAPVALVLLPSRLSLAVAGAALVESALVVAQRLGLDPLLLLGWHAAEYANPRMRAYGTLGNPDFVAAWLCASLPLVWPLAARSGLWRAAAVLQLVAIAATGSRAAAAGLVASALVMILGQRGRLRLWTLAGALAVAASVVALNPRPLGETAHGRIYYLQVVAAHWREIPLTGCGAGAFLSRFAAWQQDWLSSHSDPQIQRFAGPLDHAHNDYVELAVDFGPLALAAFLLLLAWRLRRACGSLPALAGLAALAAIAVVDFPLHRPAESALFWLLLGWAGAANSRPDPSARSNPSLRITPRALLGAAALLVLGLGIGRAALLQFQERARELQRLSREEGQKSGLSPAQLKAKYPTPEISLVSSGCLLANSTAEVVVKGQVLTRHEVRHRERQHRGGQREPDRRRIPRHGEGRRRHRPADRRRHGHRSRPRTGGAQ